MTTKINFEWIKFFLIFCSGFFLPWGGNLEEVGGYPPVLFIVSVALLSFFLIKTGIRLPPLAVRVFLLFIITHIVITVLIFRMDYLLDSSLTFGRQSVVSETNARWILKLGFLIAFFFIILSVIRSKRELLVLTTSFVLGLLSTCLIKWDIFLQSFPFYRFSGGYDDPNAFGLSAGMAFLFALFVVKETQKASKLIAFLLALLCLVMVVSSQSRGAWLSVAIASFYIAMRRSILNWISLIAIGIILYLCSSLLPDRLLDMQSWVDDGGTGRLSIWREYLSNMKEFFFLGLGFARENQITIGGIYGVEKIPHNFALEIFVKFGLFGLLSLLWMLWSFWKGIFAASLESADKTFFVSLFLFWAFSTFFLNSLMFRETWLCWGVLCFAVLLIKEPSRGIDAPKEINT